MKYIQYRTVDVKTQKEVWDEIEVSIEEARKAYALWMKKEPYYIEGIGGRRYLDYKVNEISTKSHKKTYKHEKHEPTKYDKNPPSQTDLQCIKAYVWNKHYTKIKCTKELQSDAMTHIGSCFTWVILQKFFWANCKAIWNGEQERLEEVLYEGHELIKQEKFGDKQIFNS